MKTFTKEEIQEILRKHQLWLDEKEGGERADFSGAYLSYADLSRAYLSYADLSGADLTNARGVPGIACPEKGSFIGFKKARRKIVELLILEDSMRSSATTRKCRCSKAKVLSITNLDGSDAGIKAVQSGRTANFVYSVGETVEVPDFETDRWKECAPGIHFFITRQEAVEY